MHIRNSANRSFLFMIGVIQATYSSIVLLFVLGTPLFVQNLVLRQVTFPKAYGHFCCQGSLIWSLLLPRSWTPFVLPCVNVNFRVDFLWKKGVIQTLTWVELISDACTLRKWGPPWIARAYVEEFSACLYLSPISTVKLYFYAATIALLIQPALTLSLPSWKSTFSQPS